MTMNYIGSISILDRGDAPAQAVIDRNARSLAQRISDETRDELNKVMTRVQNIYGAMDIVDDTYLSPSMEYVNDLSELEAILKDEIKKRQYQQQVTVFIVGYSDICHQKLRLLQQVNEFFMENCKNIDEEDWFPTTPDMDLDEVSSTVEDSLNYAHELTKRLAELNKDMITYMTAAAEKKASNKGRKKIEKALQQAKEDVSGLSEKLLLLQKELEDREEKVHVMVKQMESKNLEVQKFRTAAELAKAAAGEIDMLQKEMALREAKIIAQRQQISKLEVELMESNHMKEKSLTKLSLSGEESQQKIVLLQKELDEQKKQNEDVRKEMTKHLDHQISVLHESHRQAIEDLKIQYESETKKMQAESEELRIALVQSQQDLIDLQTKKGVFVATVSSGDVARVTEAESGSLQETSETSDVKQSSRRRKLRTRRPFRKQQNTESQPEIKEPKGKSLASGDKKNGKNVTKSPTRTKGEVRSGGTKTDKEFAEVAIQDEGGNPDTATVDEKNRSHAKPRASLQPVLDSDLGFDLLDESIWTSIPTDQINGKFAQYRRLTTHRLQELEEQLQLTTAKTKRKVATLKAQFQEHKSKWEAERKVLIEQIDQSLKLQTDAEKEADAAMTQLEEFITEQEKLEQEEEHKRNEALQVTSSLTPQEVTSSLGSRIHTPIPGQLQGAGGVTLTPESEQELLRLMQQTDDAKVQEMNARLGTCVSAPPAVDMERLSIQRSEHGSKDDSPDGGDTKPAINQDLPKTPTIDLPEIAAEESGDRKSTVEVPMTLQPVESTLHSLELPSVDLLEGYPLIAQKEKTPNPGETIQSEENATKYQNERESTLGDVEFQRDMFSESSEMTLSKQSTMILFSAKQRSRLGQSTSSIEVSKVDGTTEEELRAASAQSRASLRQQFKMKLGEAKLAAEDRRSKSPAILLPTQLTVDDELMLDEDDDETEDAVNEIGTSPPPGFKSTPRLSAQSFSEIINKEFAGHRRDLNQPVVQKIIMKGISIREHPLLKEYLTVYNGVLGFKDGVGKTFLDKDLMSAHQMMSDLETLSFDYTKKAMPQIVELTQNIVYVLEEVGSLINSVLVFDREPPVSALNMLSREQTQRSLVPNDPPKDAELSPATAESSISAQTGNTINLSEKLHIKELQEQYHQLKEQLEEDRKNYQEQIQRNTVVMKEMQQTINDLQRELMSMDKSPLRTKSALSNSRGTGVHHKSPSPEASVMFTRLDSERNSKIMKKAVMDDKLDPEKYKEAISRMDEYVSLPARRLAHLVKKYIHHTRMKEIEDNVKNSSSVDDEVVDVLNKMEDLQNQRAKQWAQKMDEMGLERLKLANILMETLDTIEQQSGIFLIKPMYSYRGREVKPTNAHKLSRPSRIHRSLTPSKDPGSTTIPAPTPSSHYRLVKHEKQFFQHHPTMSDMKSPDMGKEDLNGEVKVTGSGMAFIKSSPKSMWNMQASHSWSLKNEPVNSFNTPRILELDVNRMLIGQNNISTKVPFPQTDDRLVNAQQNTLRSYVTVNRPTAPLGGDWVEKKPSSGHNSAGSSGSSRSKKVTISEIDRGIPNKLPTSQPLPPITPTTEDDHGPGVDGHSDVEEPPASPPGSSLYQSTGGNEGRHSRSRHTASSQSDTEDDC